MKRIGLMIVATVSLVLMPNRAPIVSTASAAEPQFMWCWSASLKYGVNQQYYSNIFSADPADRLTIQAAYLKFLQNAYPNPGATRCYFEGRKDSAETRKNNAKAENKFDNWESVETGWSYDH